MLEAAAFAVLSGDGHAALRAALVRDTYAAAVAIWAARAAALPPGAGPLAWLRARLDVAAYQAWAVGLPPALVRNAAIALWDVLGLAAQQAAARRARRRALAALRAAPRDSADAVLARAAAGRAGARMRSAAACAVLVLRIALRDAATAACETLAGAVGTFLAPGAGTFIGELVGGLLLAPRLGLEPLPDRSSLSEELFDLCVAAAKTQ
jgi:hypothetical protein